jgi:DNA-binding NtrC family response regulator
MERVAALVRAPVVTAVALDFLGDRPSAREPDWLAGDLPTAVARLEAAMIRRALEASNGNRSDAAQRLGIHRQLLYAKLRRYGIEASENPTEAVPDADSTAAAPDG